MRAEGQPAAEVLELVVAPALGLADRVGDRLGVQRRARGASSSSRARIAREPCTGSSPNSAPGTVVRALAVDLLHLLDVRRRASRSTRSYSTPLSVSAASAVRQGCDGGRACSVMVTMARTLAG